MWKGPGNNSKMRCVMLKGVDLQRDDASWDDHVGSSKVDLILKDRAKSETRMSENMTEC
jgi:hypothetical protein